MVGSTESGLPEIEFPEKLRFLFSPARYKVLYGGRAGLKSWSAARALALMGAQRPLRVLCCRELQKSLVESVHQLLSDQIALLGLQDFYVIEKARIYATHRDGGETEFAFTGLRDAQNLKSYEGFDIAVVEEAANISKRSLDLLIPTIRKPGSEIWFLFNPALQDDAVYRKFVLNPPPNAIVVKTSWRDNKWLSAEMQAEIEHSRLTDPDGYLTTWEGHPQASLEGAIYEKEMRALTQANRITRVPYTPGVPVQVFFDLGIADQTALWFVQSIGFDWRFIDCYQERNVAWAHYLDVLQKRGYVYSYLHLPHDGKRRDLGTGKSIEHHSIEAGYKVKIVPSIGLQNGLNAARNLFARAWFDEERCADGLNGLRRYRWKVDPLTKIFAKEPLHGDESNIADAYRMAAVGLTEPERKREEQRERRPPVSAWS